LLDGNVLVALATDTGATTTVMNATRLPKLRQDTAILVEMLLSSERFCSTLDGLAADVGPNDSVEIRLKLSQCRAVLKQLQAQYEKDELTIASKSIRDAFCHAILLMMWAAFYARSVVDFKTFRGLVTIESSFNYLLSSR